MNTEEKLTIAKNWCSKIDISLNRTWAMIHYDRTQANCFEYSPTYADYDELVDAIYEMVSEYVWNEVNDWIFK